MASYDKMNVITKSDVDGWFPEFWDDHLYANTMRREFFGSKGLIGGEGFQKAIVEKKELMKEPGDKIHLLTMSDLKGAGITGDTVRIGNEEKLYGGSFAIDLEWGWHGVGIDERASKGAMKDAVLLAGKKLAPWHATLLSDQIFKALYVTAGSKMSRIYSDKAADRDALVLGDGAGRSDKSLDLDDISMVYLALQRKNALPLMVRRLNGSLEKFYGLVISEIDAFNLITTAAWKQAQREANIRGTDNPALTGALGVFGRMIIYTYSSIAGKKGTPMRPEGVLKVAYDGSTNGNAGDTTVTIGAIAADKCDYTRNFPTSGNIWLGNPTDGTIENIKLVRVAYTGKSSDGNTFTGCTSDTSFTSTIAVETIATLENVSQALGFGSEICGLGWGLMPTRTSDVTSHGQHIGIGLKWVNGVKAIEDYDAVCPNAVILETYSENPGTV